VRVCVRGVCIYVHILLRMLEENLFLFTYLHKKCNGPSIFSRNLGSFSKIESALAPVSKVERQPSVGCVLITYSLIGTPISLQARRKHKAGLE
jgi:hypothetical protein